MMRRTLAVLTLLATAALSGGCASMHETGSAPNTGNANNAPTAAAPQSQPVSSNTATVGGAQPPQAKPSPTSQAGIKPPTKNQH